MDTKQGRLFQKLQIGVASPKQIRNWAERYLPNGETVGEVSSWETVNYKTLKPEPNGLFCQKIFGPVVDFTCACGKKSNKVQIGFCSKCGVERTNSRVRRYRLGYIKLKQPIVHPLYASHKPSPLSLCLIWSNKRLQAIANATEFCHLSIQFRIFCSDLEFIPFYKKTNLNRRNQYSQLDSNLLNKKGNMGTDLQQNSLPYPKEDLILKKVGRGKKFFDSRFFSASDLAIKTNLFLKTRVDKKREINSVNGSTASLKTEFSKQSSNFVLFDSFTKKQQKKPRLFEKKQTSNKISHLYPLTSLDLGLHIYGIAYDCTWRQVEDLQEFLFFMWEHSFNYESSIPYYALTKPLEKKSQEIPFTEQYYPIQTGGFVFQQILSHFDLIRLQRQLKLQQHELKTIIFYIQEKTQTFGTWDKEKLSLIKKLNRLKQLEKTCLRRLQYIRDFHQIQIQPSWMILSYLPVLPPGLRPITSIRGELIVSDINSLYRKVLIRNKRITTGSAFGIFDTALSGSWASWCYNLRQVQEAVDSLLKTGSIESGKTTKSLLDALKGKKGRFRQHLLGKRVDYSGRSVIVVGPNLKIHECGLPKQMAIELFQPFLIQKLRKKGIVFTTTAAKALIAERRPIVWTLLTEILKNHPILLNRAPTLHRLGIQAFLPQLVEGKAILLHPLVCPAFNADFDGDQMAVHVPLSVQARAEAFNLLWARNHVLAPASGQPLLLPTQDMVLGFYYLTCSKEHSVKALDSFISIKNTLSLSRKQSDIKKNRTSNKKEFFSTLYFSEIFDIKKEFDRGVLDLHSPVWVKWLGRIQSGVSEFQAKKQEIFLETRITLSGQQENIFADRSDLSVVSSSSTLSYFRTTVGRVLMHYCIYQTRL